MHLPLTLLLVAPLSALAAHPPWSSKYVTKTSTFITTVQSTLTSTVPSGDVSQTVTSTVTYSDVATSVATTEVTSLTTTRTTQQVIQTATATQTVTATASATIPPPANFTPIRSIYNLADTIERNDEQGEGPPSEHPPHKSKFGDNHKPSVVTTVTPTTTTTTAVQTKTETVPSSTLTIVTLTSVAESSTTTITSTIARTSLVIQTDTLTSATTTTSTTTTTVTPSPRPTFYGACASNNILNEYPAGQFVAQAFIPDSLSLGNQSTAYDCCVACFNRFGCGGSFFSGNVPGGPFCLGLPASPLTGSCNSSEVKGTWFSSETDLGAAVSNSPCGQWGYGGSLRE